MIKKQNKTGEKIPKTEEQKSHSALSVKDTFIDLISLYYIFPVISIVYIQI